MNIKESKLYHEPFDRYMMLLQNQPKNFICKGPQKISKVCHRTQSSLLMVDCDGEDKHLLQAGQDLYLGDTNFSDLPDLPSFGTEEM